MKAFRRRSAKKMAAFIRLLRGPEWTRAFLDWKEALRSLADGHSKDKDE
jgi:hypothetical protein